MVEIPKATREAYPRTSTAFRTLNYELYYKPPIWATVLGTSLAIGFASYLYFEKDRYTKEQALREKVKARRAAQRGQQ